MAARERSPAGRGVRRRARFVRRSRRGALVRSTIAATRSRPSTTSVPGATSCPPSCADRARNSRAGNRRTCRRRSRRRGRRRTRAARRDRRRRRRCAAPARARARSAPSTAPPAPSSSTIKRVARAAIADESGRIENERRRPRETAASTRSSAARRSRSSRGDSAYASSRRSSRASMSCGKRIERDRETQRASPVAADARRRAAERALDARRAVALRARSSRTSVSRLAFARDRDDVAGGVDDLALAAIRDHAELGAAFVGGDERNAVLVRAHARQQVGLDVLERARIAAARDPGGRHDERLRAAVDERARDRRKPAVGADEDAQRADRPSRPAAMRSPGANQRRSKCQRKSLSARPASEPSASITKARVAQRRRR